MNKKGSGGWDLGGDKRESLWGKKKAPSLFFDHKKNNQPTVVDSLEISRAPFRRIAGPPARNCP
jgi:hypothetical protein